MLSFRKGYLVTQVGLGAKTYIPYLSRDCVVDASRAKKTTAISAHAEITPTPTYMRSGLRQ